MIRFVHPYLLFILSLIPVVGVVWWWTAARAAARLADLVAPALQPRLLPSRSRARTVAQLVLALAALTLLTIAAARPQWGRRDETIITRGRNLLIAIDVSRSMLAADVHPNRLERAKVDTLDLIAELKGDNAGLLAFRNKGALLCPLTTDYTFLRQALDGLSPESAPRGETDLADGIRKSLDALEGMAEDYNAILMISDGEQLTGDAVEAAREAGRRGIPIFTVGIGGPDGAPIPGETAGDMFRFQGQVVQTRLMDATLSAIAHESGGTYIPLATAGTAHTTLGAIYRRHLRTVSAKERQETLENQYVERYFLFLLPAILAFFAVACLSRGRLAGSRTRAPAPPPLPRTLALIASLCLIQAARAADADDASTTNAPAATVTVDYGTGRVAARRGQALYRHGNYEEAAAAFNAAARGADTETAAAWRYNAALAWLKADKHDEAATLLRALTHSRTVGPRAAELLGSAALKQSRAITAEAGADARTTQLETAATALQTALRDAPEDSRRRRNLARVAPDLPEARENAHIETVLKAHPQPQPDALLETLFREQRALLREIPHAFTNDAPRLIATAEALAERESAAADLLIPLKRVLLESGAITNEQQRATIAMMIESARDSMHEAKRNLRDLDATALHQVAKVEPFTYALWKEVAAPPPLVDEAIAMQSNTLATAEQPELRSPQPEALDLTRRFRERFPAWADQVQQQAQADTNAPTLTPEARAEIEQLAAETEGLQAEALHSPTPASYQRYALDNLLRIRELLPKQPQSGQAGQPPPEPQPQEQPDPSESPQPPPEQEQPQQEQEQPEEQPEQKPEPPKDVQELLRRALEREKEHEEEKRQQMRNIPLAPNERDW